jgi:hypothetical protein
VVLVHIGRPTIRAIESGEAHGLEFAADGQVVELIPEGALQAEESKACAGLAGPGATPVKWS